jgi:glycosyltransferase involved in cell wall biosynthesis
MATYNRANIIGRAIDSVLVQSYINIELIIVDDGSEDETSAILAKYPDPRIRVFKHEHNKGQTAAKNTGLKQVKGEWFTTFDSDDEMKPDAIETMMRIPLYFDKTITSVTCNCWEPISMTLLGQGLYEDGYIKGNEVMPLCEGDFWGLTKTCLLMGDYFNENLEGIVSSLWYKINDRANGYYIHKALIIVHVEGKDRVSNYSNLKVNFDRQILHYENLINEELYLKITKKFRPVEFYKLCKTGLIMMRINRNKYLASKYYELLKFSKHSIFAGFVINYNLPVSIYKVYFKLRPVVKNEISILRSSLYRILHHTGTIPRHANALH